MRPVSVPEISAAAERARERLRGEFDQLRVGIEKLQAEGIDGEGPHFAISDGAERAREKLRGEFDQLRVGIEKLRAKGGR
jgi:hypothetical protein